MRHCQGYVAIEPEDVGSIEGGESTEDYEDVLDVVLVNFFVVARIWLEVGLLVSIHI